MKRKFSKILGVGLTLSLLISLLLTAAPVLADVGSATVDVTPDEISLAGKYTINFTVNNDLTADDDTITVRFPADTVVPTGAITAFTIAASPGWVAGVWQTGFVSTAITALGDKDDRTVVFDLDCATTANGEIGETATVRIEFATAAGIINPTETGAYTLEVKTSDETDYVESEAYDIDAPVVGGFVYVYNPSDILMATFGGSAALNDAQAPTDYYGKEGFTLKVGPGTYVLTVDVTISGKGVTLESSAGAADTIIDGDANSIIIDNVDATHTGEDVVIDGFTIDDADEAIIIDSDDATVQNCTITDATAAGVLIDAAGTDATVTDCVIEDCAIGVHFSAAVAGTDYGDVDITGNEITETSGNGGIVFEDGSEDIDIAGNTITGNDNSGIYFADGGVACDDITISGNTISGNADHGIELANATAAPINLVIRENDILDNEADGIFILGANSWSATLNYIMFNNILGNDDAEIDNDSAGDVLARFNWWGTEVEADFEGELEGLVDADYEPFLVSTWETAVSGSKVAVDGETSLDAKDAAGVKISGVEDTTNTLEAAIISAAKYIANPEGAIDDAIAFFDVYVLLETGFDVTDVIAKLKFYDATITETSTAHFWTGDFWALCSDLEARDGIIYVTISDDTLPALDELEETIFVVVAGEAVTALAAPVLLAPAIGADDVALTPTFAWGAVVDADGYDFQLAANADFVLPMVSLTGDPGRLIVTAYAYVGELPYTTPYYWRVKAVSADDESGWASGVFITMAEPEEPIPPVVIEPTPPAPPAPVITIEQPDIIVPLPDVTSITPSWIYVIIGVGGVLVIALLVLIVRTRRVA